MKKKSKIIFILISAAIIITLSIFGIQKAINLSFEKGWLINSWTTGDFLNYYASIFAAISTLILGIIAIWQTNKANEINKILLDKEEESSAAVRERGIKARNIQSVRFQDSATIHNGGMTSSEIQRFCQLDEKSKAFLEQAFQRLGLSARAHSRILKVARTIADLAGSESIQLAHLAEAIQYRTLDKKLWK